MHDNVRVRPSTPPVNTRGSPYTFYARQQIYAKRVLAIVEASVRPFVRLFVCHCEMENYVCF